MKNKKLMEQRHQLEQMYNGPSVGRSYGRSQTLCETPIEPIYTDMRDEVGCRPILICCALTCLLTVGFLKGSELSSMASMLPQAIQAKGGTNQMPNILSASRSTITGFADAESMTAAYYWTFTLKNSDSLPHEAIMNIVLPQGATISRATLWVNGVPQEAAFSSTWRVNNAYEWVKNGRQQPHMRPDPLVITQVSPGVAQVKASPVNPGGAEMKLRIGFTSPLSLTDDGNTTMQLPYIGHSNFRVANMQDVHIQSRTLISANNNAVKSVPDQDGFLLKANFNHEQLDGLRIKIDRPDAPAIFAARATHSPLGTFILASLRPDGSGKTVLSLEKVTKRPSCLIIDSEAVAHRLSTLWAYAQVEGLVKSGDAGLAEEVAHIHRIVSSVSGATVLELDSDYSATGLTRDQYATLKYHGQRRNAGGGSGGTGWDSLGVSVRRASQPQVSAPTAAPAGFGGARIAAPKPKSIDRAESDLLEGGAPDGFDTVTTSLTTNEPIVATNEGALAPIATQNLPTEQLYGLSAAIVAQIALVVFGLALALHGLINKSTTVLVGHSMRLTSAQRFTAGSIMWVAGSLLVVWTLSGLM